MRLPVEKRNLSRCGCDSFRTLVPFSFTVFWLCTPGVLQESRRGQRDGGLMVREDRKKVSDSSNWVARGSKEEWEADVPLIKCNGCTGSPRLFFIFLLFNFSSVYKWETEES